VVSLSSPLIFIYGTTPPALVSRGPGEQELFSSFHLIVRFYLLEGLSLGRILSRRILHECSIITRDLVLA
jgi:hypothetical protein